MRLSPTRVIEIIGQSLNITIKDIKNKKVSKDFERSIIYELKQWVENSFKSLYYHVSNNGYYKKYSLKEDFAKEDVNPECLALWVYTSFLRIKYKDYASDALKELESASKNFGSKLAHKYLNFGTGTFSDNDIYYKDVNIECKANDVFATISLKILKENEVSYSSALDFIVNLLQKDFPIVILSNYLLRVRRGFCLSKV